MKKYEEITRDDVIKLLASGHKLTNAGLYEPLQAPKGTRFALFRPRGLVRIHPPKAEKGTK